MVNSLDIKQELIQESIDLQLNLEQQLKEYGIFAYDTYSLLFLYNFSPIQNLEQYIKLKKQKEHLQTNMNNPLLIMNKYLTYSVILNENFSILSHKVDHKNELMFQNEVLKKDNLQLDDFTNIQHSMTITYSRPKMIQNTFYCKNINFNEGLNFNIPLNEILSLINNAYKAYHNNNQIPSFAPYEILYQKLIQADDSINIYKPRGKVILKNTRNIFKSKKKIADMLYVYDGYKLGMTQEEIIRGLSLDYDKSATRPNADTIHLYYSIAKEYIEDFKYDEIYSGIAKSQQI